MTTYSARPDWEIELVVVIGRTARDLIVEDALSCVAGYTVGNDLSARDLRSRPEAPLKSLFRADWLRHKSFDNSAPMGPWMTPTAYLADPADLGMRLWVNDEIKQDATSASMIFSAAEQIAHLSSGITLHPGDLITTGTPAGVGAGRGESPGVWRRLPCKRKPCAAPRAGRRRVARPAPHETGPRGQRGSRRCGRSLRLGPA